MSYYMMNYSMTNPGTPGERFAPVPGWGMNPAAAGPRRVGVGQDDRAAADIEDRYRQTSWGVVAATAAGGLLLGVFLGYLARGRKGLTPNRRGSFGRRAMTPNRSWSTKYKNSLPDSAFAYVAPGGHRMRKDGKVFTIPKSKRKLPYRDRAGNLNRRHLANAIARVSQKKTRIPTEEKKKIRRKLQNIYAAKYGYAKGRTQAPRRLRAA